MQLAEDGCEVSRITLLKRTVLNKGLKANVMGFSIDMISDGREHFTCL